MTNPTPRVVDSRVWRGRLTFTPPDGDELDFTCQVTNIRVTADYDNDGDVDTTLCGAVLGAPRRNNGYHLQGTFINDFDNPLGINAFTVEHELDDVPFTFLPNDTGQCPTITGAATVEIVDFGGDVRTRNKTDFDWHVAQRPVWTYPAAPPAAEAAQAASSAAPPAAEPTEPAPSSESAQTIETPQTDTATAAPESTQTPEQTSPGV